MVLFLALAVLIPAQAKDEVRVSVPSKVESAKRKEREKLFTDWMTLQDLHVKEEEMWKKGAQIIYFEYDSGRTQWRAIYSTTLKLKGQYTWYASVNEGDAETKLNNEIKLGRQPAFIVRDNGSYAMLFITPEDTDAVRKELAALGIGEPKLKK